MLWNIKKKRYDYRKKSIPGSEHSTSARLPELMLMRVDFYLEPPPPVVWPSCAVEPQKKQFVSVLLLKI